MRLGALRRNGEGNDEHRAAMRPVQGELHAVPGDTGQVDSIERDRQLPEPEQHGQAARPQAGVLDEVRLAEQAAHRVQFVDERS